MTMEANDSLLTNSRMQESLILTEGNYSPPPPPPPSPSSPTGYWVPPTMECDHYIHVPFDDEDMFLDDYYQDEQDGFTAVYSPPPPTPPPPPLPPPPSSPTGYWVPPTMEYDHYIHVPFDDEDMFLDDYYQDEQDGFAAVYSPPPPSPSSHTGYWVPPTTMEYDHYIHVPFDDEDMFLINDNYQDEQDGFAAVYEDAIDYTPFILDFPTEEEEEGEEEEEEEGDHHMMNWIEGSLMREGLTLSLSTNSLNYGMVPATMESMVGLEKGGAVVDIEDYSCPICLEELPCGSRITRMPCCHGFHDECIVRWLKTSNCCPMCRYQL